MRKLSSLGSQLLAKRLCQGALVALLCLVAVSPAAGPASRPAKRTVVPGVEYIHEQHAEGPLSIHIVKMDLARQDLKVLATLANGVILGRQTVRAQVGALPRRVGQPIAAINGDYFEMGRSGDARYKGSLQGIHIGSGELVHGPMAATFWMDTTGRPHLTLGAQPRFVLRWPDGSKASFGINCSTTAHKTEVGAADLVLFTPAFGTSTRTEGGLELVMSPAKKSDWLPLRANGSYTGVIQSMSRTGDTRITEGAIVLSVVSKLVGKLPSLRPGDTITFTTGIEPDLSKAEQAVGGDPPLLVNGKPHPRAADRKNRHPRTAIGFSATHLFLVVVDGRQRKLSRGMSHGELADLMARLGCTNALNLDGGGSSTLWLDGAVVNSPSDSTGERPVGNAVVIVRRPTGDSPAR